FAGRRSETERFFSRKIATAKMHSLRGDHQLIMAKLDIHIDDLVITYNKGKANEFNALQHIKGEIYPREYIILFGPSGCGKSTLLYTILGGIPPEGGHMWVKGEDIYAYSPEDMNKY